MTSGRTARTTSDTPSPPRATSPGGLAFPFLASSTTAPAMPSRQPSTPLSRPATHPAITAPSLSTQPQSLLARPALQPLALLSTTIPLTTISTPQPATTSPSATPSTDATSTVWTLGYRNRTKSTTAFVQLSPSKPSTSSTIRITATTTAS